MRKNFTLSIDEDLSHRMKFQALREKRDVSTITEALYREYLEQHKGFMKSIEKGKQKL